jgi:hypothetical protein
MDWLIQIVDRFEDMPTDKAALLLLFLALLLLGGLMLLMLRRDKSTAVVDLGQTTALVNVTTLATSLSDGLKSLSDAMRDFTEQLRLGTAGQTAHLAAIHTEIAGVPASVEEGMQPKLTSLEERINASLDALKRELKQELEDKIGKLPGEVAAAVTALLNNTQQKIIDEIKGDGCDGKSSEPIDCVGSAADSSPAGTGDPGGAGRRG